ncbi:MAG: penicillin-binding protein 1C [bacterium]|nr:penicillin-binding protein 1C [bacterium]
MSAHALYGYMKVRRQRKILRRKWYLFLFWVFLVWYADCLPKELFNDSTSTVLVDSNGNLLGAHIADDQQWRFPESKNVPYKFKTCIIQFEDRKFYQHWGVSARGVGRALWQNLTSGERVSGGSTLTMQLVRLMRKNPPRTYSEKLYEMILATRIEMRYSKSEILKIYVSHAPFGNNVVGLDAASWRFFGRPANQLSWAESATLAVLPNAPGLIYPGRNHDLLRDKRNRLLKRLRKIGKMSESEYRMALLERLPEKPHPLPNLAPHLLQKCIAEGKKGQVIRTNIRSKVQSKVNFLLDNHAQLLRENGIFNGAIMVTSVETGEVLAYVGNVVSSGKEHANQVNCIDASRSTGSIIKPLLYGKSLESGTIAPSMFLRDVPSRFGNFSPKNFAGTFEGLIPANEALSRSLNIPMVHLLQQYGLTKFHHNLQRMGFSTIRKSATHYGLSLILGGAEVNMFELNQVYTNMAQQLRFQQTSPLYLFPEMKEYKSEFPMSAGSIYATFEAMLDVRRPDEDNNWHMFDSSRKIAWKTGTSYGFRDAWAVGVTPDYVVSVWVGNADGEGRPGLTGVQAAAPILFDIFQTLPIKTQWFEKPESDLVEVDVCTVSGHRPTENCEKQTKAWWPKGSLQTTACPYHQRIHLNKNGQRVNSSCADPMDMTHANWMIVAPDVEEYYKKHHPLYLPLPPFLQHCEGANASNALSILYPDPGQKIYLPVGFNGEQQATVFRCSHSNNDAVLFWHLDGQFVQQTSEFHEIVIRPEIGKHQLTVYDTEGAKKSVWLEVVAARKEIN